ncbi:hypothetical protein [Brevibacillus laterosporus]|uniref:hypothetical protein n=1 Tax=Brevibacillus laterosporus TaxID=1465 RepID=UPI000E6D2D01|nr:hypothetical protein [Brevibacillus laterosporus]AYB36803.1 hypothetical protein D5F52_00060 [Brevibacillus laterosporus]AYB41050.1 hypothetical protein D5F52_23955 [Brevibacillus laterosporus]MBM7106966.1 hypothetical protein [Brevibacillus laterosporus]
MIGFRFAPLLSRYNSPYVLVKPGTGGAYNPDGVWEEATPDRVSLLGHIQPVSAKLQQVEGGRYTEEDRTLYTTNKHAGGDLIEYKGVKYTVHPPEERDYCDINKYILKKVAVHDSV